MYFKSLYGLATMFSEGVLVRYIVPYLGEINSMRLGLLAFAGDDLVLTLIPPHSRVLTLLPPPSLLILPSLPSSHSRLPSRPPLISSPLPHLLSSPSPSHLPLPLTLISPPPPSLTSSPSSPVCGGRIFIFSNLDLCFHSFLHVR